MRFLVLINHIEFVDLLVMFAGNIVASQILCFVNIISKISDFTEIIFIFKKKEEETYFETVMNI